MSANRGSGVRSKYGQLWTGRGNGPCPQASIFSLTIPVCFIDVQSINYLSFFNLYDLIKNMHGLAAMALIHSSGQCFFVKEIGAGVGAATDPRQLLNSRVHSSLVLAYSRVCHTRRIGRTLDYVLPG